MDKRQQEDMKPEYDFSKGVRGAVVPKEKVQASLEKSLEDNAEVWGELAGGTTEDWKKPKGGCPRCEGTKKILRAAEGRPDLIGEEDCPDCGGTGERRKGERRKERRRSKFGRRSWDFPGISEVKSADRRAGEERRQK